jgi:UDP-N-acetylglucosamine:LPS N-acetylglucosamine transferase
MVTAGAALLVPDSECTGPRLGSELKALLDDPDQLGAMGAAARALGHPDAAARIAEVVDGHAR